MAELEKMGEFVRSASSTIEAPVVRRLKNTFSGGSAKPGGGGDRSSVPRPGPAPAGREQGGRDQGSQGDVRRGDRIQPRGQENGSPVTGGGSVPAPAAGPAVPTAPSTPLPGAGLPGAGLPGAGVPAVGVPGSCLLYTSDAADDLLCVDL